MQVHDAALACRKFAESEAEDPREGTLINLARCEEARGKLATARQFWQQAVDLARFLGDARIDYAQAQLAAIDGRVPRLTVRLDADAPPNATVRRDGIEFTGGSLGVALPTETGHHVVSAVAPGHEAREYSVDLVEGEKRELSVVPGPAEQVPSDATASADIAASPNSAPSPSLRGLAYGLGGLGVIALGTGVGFGIAALNDSGAASGHCQGDVCDAQGARSRGDEQNAASVSTDLLLSGVALASAGAALRVLTPSEQERPFVRRRLAYLTGGLGLAGVSVGLVLGARAVQQLRDSQSGCNGNLCEPVANQERRNAIDAGNASTVGLAVGGTLLAGGVVLWLTDPSRGSGGGGGTGASSTPTLAFSAGGTRGGGGMLRMIASW
jgi:hypothetical protein